jgi:hypothetical protein
MWRLSIILLIPVLLLCVRSVCTFLMVLYILFTLLLLIYVDDFMRLADFFLSGRGRFKLIQISHKVSTILILTANL